MADSTSFASILAGVKRLREKEGGAVVDSTALARPSGALDHSLRPAGDPTPGLAPPLGRPPDPLTGLLPTNAPIQSSTTTPLVRNAPILASLVESPQIPLGERVPQMPRRVIPALAPPPKSATVRVGPRAAAVLTTIKVNKAQQGNPLLKSLKNGVAWEYATPLVPDFLINTTFSVFFLSLKYHRLHPEYIYLRIQKSGIATYDNPMMTQAEGGASGASFDNGLCHILMVMVDIENHTEALQELNQYCLMHNLTLMLGWSFEECAKYVVACKHGLDNRSTNVRAIKGLDNDSPNVDFPTRFGNVVTRVPRINKTDATNLLREFGCFRLLVLEPMLQDRLEAMTGFGDTKIENLRRMFDEPFIFNRAED